jgi:hypothetical protein
MEKGEDSYTSKMVSDKKKRAVFARNTICEFTRQVYVCPLKI